MFGCVYTAAPPPTDISLSARNAAYHYNRLPFYGLRFRVRVKVTYASLSLFRRHIAWWLNCLSELVHSAPVHIQTLASVHMNSPLK